MKTMMNVMVGSITGYSQLQVLLLEVEDDRATVDGVIKGDGVFTERDTAALLSTLDKLTILSSEISNMLATYHDVETNDNYDSEVVANLINKVSRWKWSH